MTKPSNTQNINHNVVNSTKNIEDLDDHMLTQILFKLPSCASILACTPINKRWYSLISDPGFASQFSDHKTRNATLLKTRPNNSNNNIDGNGPEWTHLVTRLDSGRSLYCVGNASTNEVVFESPKFDLEFMPCHCIVEATFMDLVLCLDVETSSVRRDDWIYYVTNPLTKQWFALPPCPVVRNERGFKPTAAFVCRQPYDYTRDYQFRVVLISKTIAHVIRLSVYCSEIDMWKVIYLRFELLVQMHREHTESVQQVVCNGIIYLYHKSCFAAFNPFDVDETTEKATTIDAKVLPSLQVKGVLLECSGNLYVICNPESEGRAVFCYNICKTVATSLKVWKFNPNQVPLKWQTTFEGKCSGDVYKEAKRLDCYLPNENKGVKFVGMHPKDDKLIYRDAPER